MERCLEATGSQLARRDPFQSRRDAPAHRHGTSSTLRTGWVVTRTVRLIAGLALFAAGLALMLRAELGLSAWDVLHDALRSLTPLTFGQVVVAVSVVVLAASVALGVRPGVGTIANSILVGVFTDAMLETPFLQDLASGGLLPRLLAMFAGIWGIALGSALYISAELGAGPRDALMLGIAKRSRRSAGTARTAIEAAVLVLGIALGGSLGFGTAAFVILIGPAINVAFRLLGLEPPRIEGTPNTFTKAMQAVSAWGRQGDIRSPTSIRTSRETGGRV